MPKIKKTREKKSKSKKSNADSDSTDSNSVDSKGNIRDLIDYDYEESYNSEDDSDYVASSSDETSSVESDMSEEEETDESENSDEDMFEMEESVPKRKAAIQAGKAIKKLIKSGDNASTASSSKSKISRISHLSKNPKLKVEEVHMEDDEEEDDEEEDDESEEDEEVEDAPRKRRRRNNSTENSTPVFDIVLSDIIGAHNTGKDPSKPVKYNLKKEPPSVKRFVELLQTEEAEVDNIDNDITYFKSLTSEKQNQLLHVLECKASPAEVVVPIKFKILEKVAMRPTIQRIAMAKYNALCNIDPSSTEYYKCQHWINGFSNLPLGVYKDLPVKLEDGPERCGEFMVNVRKCMDEAIFGHDEAKLQIMQFISSWIANPKANGNVLSIHGPPGIGKTSLVKDGVAKALDRPFHFITLGGATDAAYLDGHSYTYEGSTWGRIVEVLIQSKCMNPVIYFDELDKVSETPKGEEIMNMLIHLTDQSQNDRFQDKYFTGIDLDLSKCLFIFSHNDHGKVNPILKDRMYNIQVKGFDLKQKLKIAQDYLVNAALKEVDLFEKISIGKEILEYIIENFTGGEAGVRELKRCIQTVISKINLLRFYNHPKLVPFAIEGFGLPFTVQKKHIDLFLKKKESIDESISHLYI
jgi:ATP-dependent Lon protease